MLNPAKEMLIYPSQSSTAKVGVAGSVPGSHPDKRAGEMKMRPITMLVSGPTMAIQNSDLASEASDSICDTPPSANRVIARTRNPRDFATIECASSCNRRAEKKRTAVIAAAAQTTVTLHSGLALWK